ncbi:MAG: hypothetical protein V9F03_07695 [Microthrixaceae bacterium]
MSELDAGQTGTHRGPVGGSVSSADDGPDWADQVTNLVVDTVDKVRDRTTGPILEFAMISVHLIVAMILLLPILALLTVGGIRLLTWAVREVWISYTIVGGLFMVSGLILWSKRSKLPI